MVFSDVTVDESKRSTTDWQALKFPALLGLASVVFIIISLVLLVKSTQTATPIQFSSAASNSGALGQGTSQITIDIQGAVAHPGVYDLPEGSRVEYAIVAAGGLTGEADFERIAREINRASKISDGAKLYIPRKNDSYIVRRDSASNPSSPSHLSTVSVNAASQSQLEALSGVGPVTAQKIITRRPYQVLEELVTKKAMSGSLFEKLKDQLTL